MAANIQVGSGTPGLGTLSAALGVPVILTDVGGGSPVSRAWTIDRWPCPIAVPPTLSTPTSAGSGFTPAVDGVYVVTLTRVESDGSTTTTQSLIVGVQDASGNVLPSPGVTENLFAQLPPSPAFASGGTYGAGRLVTNDVGPVKVYLCLSGGADASSVGPTGTGTSIVVGGLTWRYVSSVAGQQAAAKVAGWDGSTAAGTDVLLDAFLRTMRALVTDGGSPVRSVAFGDSPVTALSGQRIKVDTTLGPVIVIVPSADGVRARVKKVSSDANVVSVQPASGLIDGAASLPLPGQWDSVLTEGNGSGCDAWA